MSKALKYLYHNMTKIYKETEKKYRPFHEAALKGTDQTSQLDMKVTDFSAG